MKIFKILILTLITAAMIVSFPAASHAVGKNPPPIVGSPYTNYKKSSYKHGSIATKTGRGFKKGISKIKDGFVWTGQKIKQAFSQDEQVGWSADSNR